MCETFSKQDIAVIYVQKIIEEKKNISIYLTNFKKITIIQF